MSSEPAEQPDRTRLSPPGTGPVPEAAVTVFGDRLPVLQAYAELLATAGVERGLIGPREAPRLWERHLLNCVGLAELIPQDASVLDLGAGAGLPGLVLAATRPDLEVILLEPLLRRAAFLQEAVDNLGLPQVRVVRARAEDVAGTLQVDVVTARAVAPLERLVGWAMPLVRPGGCLLAQKGERAEEEVAASRDVVAHSGGSEVRVQTVGEEQLCTFGRVVVVVRALQGAAGPGSDGPASRRPSSSSRPRTSPKAGERSPKPVDRSATPRRPQSRRAASPPTPRGSASRTGSTSDLANPGSVSSPAGVTGRTT